MSIYAHNIANTKTNRFQMDLADASHLQQQIQEIERQNETRKLLIKLAVVRMLGLIEKPTVQSPQSLPDNVSEKLHDYELRVSVLKLQLSTKEKVHEAQVDELKDLVALLQKQLDETTKNDVRSRLVSNPTRSLSRTTFFSPPSSAGRSVSLSGKILSPGRSVLSGSSPVFTKLRIFEGKDRSFGDFEMIASQASLKLSQNSKKIPERYFSSPTSSVESTPKRGTEEPQSTGSNENANDEPDANLTHLSASEADETFQSANTTLTEDAALQKKKKKRMHLLSSHATRVTVDLQGKGLNVEDEDLNSLNYYHDDNFQEEHSSPLRPPKRALDDAEEPPRKRHVFKI